MNNIKIICLAICISLIWGSSFPISKMAIEKIGVWPFRFYAALTSVVVLILLALIAFKRKFHFYGLIMCIPLGFLNVFLVTLLNNIALGYTDSAKASVLIYTMPAMTTVIMMIAHKRITLNSIVVSLSCLTGGFIFTSLNHFGLGEMIILLSASMWALGMFLAEKIPTQLDLLSKVMYQNIVSFFLILLITLFIPSNLDIFDYQQDPLHYIKDICFPILFIGIAGGVIVFVLWFYMIEQGGAELSSYAVLVAPIISVGLSHYFLDEVISFTMLIGMVLILLSMLISFIGKTR